MPRVHEIHTSNHRYISVFFDLEKAYDTARYHGILRSWLDFGLRGRHPILIQQFYSDVFYGFEQGVPFAKLIHFRVVFHREVSLVLLYLMWP